MYSQKTINDSTLLEMSSVLNTYTVQDQINFFFC